MAWTDFVNFKGINSFLSPEKAYSAAEQPVNRGYNEARAYEEPFMQHGLDQYGRLNQAENELYDPAALRAKFAGTYETSPEAKIALESNKNAGLDAASSMGLMGSSAALNNIQVGAGNINAFDRNKYIDDLMDKYMKAVGIGQNLYGTGANMGAHLGNQAVQHGQDLAGLEYNRVAAPGNLWGKLAGAASSFMTPGQGNFGASYSG